MRITIIRVNFQFELVVVLVFVLGLVLVDSFGLSFGMVFGFIFLNFGIENHAQVLGFHSENNKYFQSVYDILQKMKLGKFDIQYEEIRKVTWAQNKNRL